MGMNEACRETCDSLHVDKSETEEMQDIGQAQKKKSEGSNNQNTQKPMTQLNNYTPTLTTDNLSFNPFFQVPLELNKDRPQT